MSATDVWTVGLNNPAGTLPGEFWHWDGGGWKKVPSSITSSLLGVWASAPNDITAVGYNGMILHFDGTLMTSQFSGTTSDLHTVWGSSRSLLFAGGAMGAVVRNDSTGWKKITVNHALA